MAGMQRIYKLHSAAETQVDDQRTELYFSFECPVTHAEREQVVVSGYVFLYLFFLSGNISLKKQTKIAFRQFGVS